MSFLAPSPPAPAAPPPMPAPPPSEDPEVAKARRKKAAARRLRRGRASTILTGGQGVTGPAPVGRKSLLGE